MSGVRHQSIPYLAGCALAGLILSGCGYVGEPLPPLLNIPQAVSDLRSIERGDQIVVEFTPPALSTEGVPLKTLAGIELRIGPGLDGPFNPDAWAAGAKLYADLPIEGDPIRYRVPAAEWVGREVVLGVNVIGPTGRPSGWSNLCVLTVVPPLSPPTSLSAVAAPEGVRLKWSGTGGEFRIFRSETQEEPVEVGRVEKAEWLDTRTRFGQSYVYSIQAIRQTGSENAESGISEPVKIVPVDTFAPSVPAGLTAVNGLDSVELVWERNTEEDFQAYRVYRAPQGGEFRPVAEYLNTPSFSDSTAEKGKSYQYAVSAVDRSGNESGRSSAVDVMFR